MHHSLIRSQEGAWTWTVYCSGLSGDGCLKALLLVVVVVFLTRVFQGIALCFKMWGVLAMQLSHVGCFRRLGGKRSPFLLSNSVISRMTKHQTPGRNSLKTSEAVTDIPKLVWEQKTKIKKNKQIYKKI